MRPSAIADPKFPPPIIAILEFLMFYVLRLFSSTNKNTLQIKL
jgi:hypothetical protein